MCPHHTPDDITARKRAARSAAQARRQLVFEAPGRAAKVAAAAAHLRAACDAALGGQGADCVLSGYIPMRSELDPLPAMRAHPGLVCVPVIVGRDQPLKFRQWAPEAQMTKGDFGALIPTRGAWLDPRVLIVPLLAFDEGGFRLGYGGGFYDRTLERLRARGPVLAVGFGFAAQKSADLPREPTDQRLDAVVTEDGIYWIEPADRAP